MTFTIRPMTLKESIQASDTESVYYGIHAIVVKSMVKNGMMTPIELANFILSDLKTELGIKEGSK
jgi:hypothetical protein